MIVHTFEQGTPEWYEARIGVITASTFDKVITPKTLKISASIECIENLIVSEILTGESAEEFQGNYHTDRGKLLEPDARAIYRMLTNNDMQQVGFITNDEKTIGCSPDSLVGEHGLLEIKCPAPKNHVSYLVNKSVGAEYMPQIQGQMLVTGRLWVDVLSYHPKMPPCVIRVNRDEEIIAKLNEALAFAWVNINTKLQSIRGE